MYSWRIFEPAVTLMDQVSPLLIMKEDVEEEDGDDDEEEDGDR